MSIGLYPGGRWNRSPSPEAKPDLDETTMLALLAPNTPDLCVRGPGSRAGAGKVNGPGSLTGVVVLLRLREGDYRDGGSEEREANTSVYPRLVTQEDNVAHGYRIALEKTVNVATRGFFDSVVWTKKAHEAQATTMIPNALRISRTYTPSVAPPSRVGMLDLHRLISRVASEMCRRAAASGVLVKRELEEGGPLKILPPGTRRKDSHPPGKHPMANARHIRPLLTFVASSMAITSKKSNELRGMRICRGLLKPSRQRGSKMWG
ncbi:hypothetical protein H4582DRAFT_2057862 [Lactarius indigo]|nr:hypothetical protein H4582DRAFT_2057862 [Lactarius indigo]